VFALHALGFYFYVQSSHVCRLSLATRGTRCVASAPFQLLSLHYVPGRDQLFGLASWQMGPTADAPLSRTALVVVDALSLKVQLAVDQFEALPTPPPLSVAVRPDSTATLGLAAPAATEPSKPPKPTNNFASPELAFVASSDMFVTLIDARSDAPPSLAAAERSFVAMASFSVDGTLLWQASLLPNCNRLRWIEYDPVSERLLGIADGVNDAKLLHLTWSTADASDRRVCSCAVVMPLPPLETGVNFAASLDADQQRLFVIAPRAALQAIDLKGGTVTTLPATTPFVDVSMIVVVPAANSSAVSLARATRGALALLNFDRENRDPDVDPQRSAAGTPRHSTVRPLLTVGIDDRSSSSAASLSLALAAFAVTLLLRM
jgi:hypothetical protein